MQKLRFAWLGIILTLVFAWLIAGCRSDDVTAPGPDPERPTAGRGGTGGRGGTSGRGGSPAAGSTGGAGPMAGSGGASRPMDAAVERASTPPADGGDGAAGRCRRRRPRRLRRRSDGARRRRPRHRASRRRPGPAAQPGHRRPLPAERPVPHRLLRRRHLLRQRLLQPVPGLRHGHHRHARRPLRPAHGHGGDEVRPRLPAVPRAEPAGGGRSGLHGGRAVPVPADPPEPRILRRPGSLHDHQLRAGLGLRRSLREDLRLHRATPAAAPAAAAACA